MKMEINNSEIEEKIIQKSLHEFNKTKCEFIKNNSTGESTKIEKCNIIVYDNNRDIIGGGIGSIQYEWYYLEELWIKENYRKQQIGSKILKKIEEISKEKNLVGIRMETWSFQAKEFYEKNYYEVYAELPNSPRGVTTYYLRKIL